MAFRIDELLAFYHCQEFFRFKRSENNESNKIEHDFLCEYMDSLRSWILKNNYSEDPAFFGGDDEDSSVVFYSKQFRVVVHGFALRAFSGHVEPIFMVKKLPATLRDNHLIVACLAIQSLRELGFESTQRAWLTTGEQHLAIVPEVENFNILNRVCTMMQAGDYQVKTGPKCRFCPIKDTCEVYDNIEQIKSLCSSGPARITL